MTFSNQTFGVETYQELGLVSDDVTITATMSTLPIIVASIKVSNSSIISKTNIIVLFTLPNTAGSVFSDCDYVSLTLPYRWGPLLNSENIGAVEIQTNNTSG